MKRNECIDCTRGIAILLVVVGHAIQFVYASGNENDNILFRYIYSFHMPLFMFISGYLTFNPERNINVKWLWKKFNALIIPFITWIFISYFLGKKDFSLLHCLLRTIKFPDHGGYWFLWVLFLNCGCLFIAVALIRFIQKYLTVKNRVTKGVAFIIVIFCVKQISQNITGLYGLGLCYWYIIFFFVGHLIAEYIPLFDRAMYERKGMRICGYIIIVSFLFLAYFWRREECVVPIIYECFEGYVPNVVLSLISKVLGYLIPFLGIFSVIYIANVLIIRKMGTLFVLFGKYTIEIYILHYYFIIGYSHSPLINTILSVVGGGILPIAFSYFLEKIPVIRKLVFGK